MSTDHDRHAIDLTQLSSREQLSALMDSALPPDQTRFLLRRLRHDEALAASWERWRLAGEVMRGLAPAQRLPADFAARVATALHAAQPQPQALPPAVARGARWRQWGGGAALAASLAVVALVLPDRGTDGPALDAPPLAVQPVRAAAPVPPRPTLPAPAPTPVDAEAVASVVAAAAGARPRRERDATRAPVQQAPRVAQAAIAESAPPALVAQADIVTRPWPRSVLPQVAGSELTVGFGDSASGAAPYNPFQAQARFDALPAPAAAEREATPAAAPPAQP